MILNQGQLTDLTHLLFISGYRESVWTAMSNSLVISASRRTIVTLRKYLNRMILKSNYSISQLYLARTKFFILISFTGGHSFSM